MKRATKTKIKVQLPFSVFISILLLNRWGFTGYSYFKFCFVLGNIMLFSLFNRLKFIDRVSELSWAKSLELGEKTSFSCQLKIHPKFTLFLIFLIILKPRPCLEKYSLWFIDHNCSDTITPVKFRYQFKIQLMFSKVIAEVYRHRTCLQNLHQCYCLQVHVLLLFMFCCLIDL